MPRLRDAGHGTIALDLPADDPDAGLTAYVEMAIAAAEGHDDVIVVTQSMGAFIAVPVCTRLAARGLAGGYPDELDLQTCFLHDVPPEVAADGAGHQRDEADVAFAEPCPFKEWPAVPTTVLAGRDDRFFPFEFQKRVAHERLGIPARPVPGGHLCALSHPDDVARALLAGT